MSKDQILSIVGGVAATVISAVLIGGFALYSDVQVMKIEVNTLGSTLADKKESYRRFEEMLSRMDVTMATHTEAVQTLKQAVARLEDGFAMKHKDET